MDTNFPDKAVLHTMRNTSGADDCLQCPRCDRWRSAPDYIRDPMVLWDRFPCPPPGTDHAKLLIELDWTGQMGPKSGCMALQRVARRCNVDFKNLHSVHVSLPQCEGLFQAGVLCGTNCFIAFILAGICVLFCLLLVIVCIRYVRREKQSSSFCSKVLSPSSAADTNTHINKDYAQTDDSYRPNGFPRRRGLPCEARVTSCGVEARLLKAIQENQLQHYVDDTCSQCHATSVSRQSTMQMRGNRLGYELIYWKEGDYFVQRVPSNDAISRMSATRDGSIYGGSVSGSHHYEYIGGHQTDCSYNSSTGRHSNHSNRVYGRNSVQNINSGTCSDPSVSCGTDLDNMRCGSIVDNYDSDKTPDTFVNYKIPWKSSKTSVTSVHSRYQDREQDLNYFGDRTLYQPLGSDKFPYSDSQCDRNLRQGYYSDSYGSSGPKNQGYEWSNNYVSKDNNSSAVSDSKKDQSEARDPHSIRGYKYVFNPSPYEDTTSQHNDDTIDLKQLQSAIFELTGNASLPSEQTLSNIPHKPNVKQRRPSACSNTSITLDSSSTSGHSNSFKKSTKCESDLPPQMVYKSDKNNLT